VYKSYNYHQFVYKHSYKHLFVPFFFIRVLWIVLPYYHEKMMVQTARYNYDVYSTIIPTINVRTYLFFYFCVRIRKFLKIRILILIFTSCRIATTTARLYFSHVVASQHHLLSHPKVNLGSVGCSITRQSTRSETHHLSKISCPDKEHTASNFPRINNRLVPSSQR
jgi:hypothetical protein